MGKNNILTQEEETKIIENIKEQDVFRIVGKTQCFKNSFTSGEVLRILRKGNKTITFVIGESDEKQEFKYGIGIFKAKILSALDIPEEYK